MSGSSSSGKSESTGQNIGSLLLANMFGQPAYMNSRGIAFGVPGGKAQRKLGISGGKKSGRWGGSKDWWTSSPGGGGQAGVGVAQQTFPNANPFTSVNQGFVQPGASGFVRGGLGTVSPGAIAPQVFQPSDMMAFRNLLNPTPSNFVQENMEGIAGGASAPLARNLYEGLGTGFRTDMSPIVALKQNRLMNETLPDIAERFAGITGGFGSDFGKAGMRAATDLGLKLGAAQTQLDEAAAARRMNYGQFAPDTMSDFQALGDQMFESANLRRPEMQLLRTFSNLFGIAPPSSGSFSKQSSKSGGIALG